MGPRRVCDACSIRRVKCDGETPCSGCLTAEIDCTRMRPKVKSGPKGIRKKTLEKVTAAKAQYEQHHGPISSNQQPLPTEIRDFAPSSEPTPISEMPPSIPDDLEPELISNGPMWPFRILLSTLEPYLDIYHHKLYPIWPIVQKDALVERLQAYEPDADAYMLASSICAATILQLQLSVAGMHTSSLEPKSMLMEIEDLRRLHEYREKPSLDHLSTGFFMHVAYLLIGRRTTSTLLLRETISLAHMLGLHRPSLYEDLTDTTTQDNLRKLWLLFITERAHASQYDIPCIFDLDSAIPAPDHSAQPSSLAAFTLLCRMFTFFHQASSDRNHSEQSLVALHNQLQQVPALTQYYNDLQRADLSITQQWMRLMLWKLAITTITMTSEDRNDIQSMLFPVHIAKDLITSVSTFSIDTLEAHGPGMELKLFEVANTVADVMICVPPQTQRTFEFRPQDFLVHLAGILGSFRGGNNALLPLLQSRLTDVGLSVPAIPRLIDISHESDSHHSMSFFDSDEALGGSPDENELATMLAGPWSTNTWNTNAWQSAGSRIEDIVD